MLLDNRKAQPLTLGDAIRAGCKIRPRQTREAFFEGDDGACALGAALAAIGLPGYQGWPGGSLRNRFSLTDEDVRFVVSLNDWDNLTREEIADYCDKYGIGVPEMAEVGRG